MTTKKDTYRYVVKSGARTVYVGVTTDFDRRADEHRRRWPSAKVTKVGTVTTRKAALAWGVKMAKDLGSSTGTSVKDRITAYSQTSGRVKRAR